MTLDEYPFEIREGLACHEAFRKLGFPAEEIFFVKARSATCDLKCKCGRAHALIAIGPVTNNDPRTARFLYDLGTAPDRAFELWQEAGDRWNGAASEAERLKIWEESVVRRGTLSLMLALQAKGMLKGKRPSDALRN